MLGWIQIVSLQVDTTQFLKFKLKYLPDIKKRWNQVSYYLDLTINCPSVSLPLKQLSKISVPWCSQEYQFGRFSASHYQSICRGVLFSKAPCFQHILLNNFRGYIKVWKLFFERRLCKTLHCKNFKWKYIKNISLRSYLRNKNKKANFMIGRALFALEVRLQVPDWPCK